MKDDMFRNCSLLISDNQGNLQNIEEIIEQLQMALDSFSTHAMSDHQLYLYGKRDALKEVIAYLKRVGNIEEKE